MNESTLAAGIPFAWLRRAARAAPYRRETDLSLALSLLPSHTRSVVTLIMRRVLQIFTCGKWHLLLVHEPFYRVRFRACIIPGRIQPKKRVLVPSSSEAFAREFIRFFPTSDRAATYASTGAGPITTQEEFTHLDSSFFQGGCSILSAVSNKEQKRIAMELK